MTAAIAGIAAIIAAAGLPPSQVPDSVPLLLTRMALDLRVDYGRQAIDGSMTLGLRNTSGRPVASIPLLLNRLMVVAG